MVDVDGFLGDRSHFSSTHHKKVYIICDGFVPRFVRPPTRAQTRDSKTYAATDKKLVLHFLPSAQLDFKGVVVCERTNNMKHL